MIFTAQQFRAPGVQFAVTVGQVFRVLDCCSDSREESAAIIFKLLGSMLLAGFDVKILLRGLRRAKRSPWCDLTQVERALQQTTEWVQRWVLLCDAHDEAGYLLSLHEFGRGLS